MTDDARLYCRDGRDAAVLRELDGLTLCYHRPSGITHILDSPLPEIIGVLTCKPQTAGELLERLAASYDLEEDEALEGLERHLEELAALGLARIAR